jgi:cell division protein FtsW
VKWSLPDAHTDFIIAVAAEEYGLILVLVIIALYTGDRGAVAGAADGGARPLHPAGGAGLACIFGVQAMINMGVAVRLCRPRG